jgi:DNA-binding PucR family transcriptional regulator
VHPGLIALRDYDRKNRTDFFRTLRVYLEHQQCVADASSALYIHRNTLLYRIRKIEEFFGFTLDNPKQVINLLLGFHILEYLNTEDQHLGMDQE